MASAAGPGLLLVPGRVAPGPALMHFVCGPETPESRRTSESSGSAAIGPLGRPCVTWIVVYTRELAVPWRCLIQTSPRLATLQTKTRGFAFNHQLVVAAWFGYVQAARRSYGWCEWSGKNGVFVIVFNELSVRCR